MKAFLKKHFGSWGGIVNSKTVKIAALGVGTLFLVNVSLSGAAAENVSWGVIGYVIALILKGGLDNLATKGEASHG